MKVASNRRPRLRAAREGGGPKVLRSLPPLGLLYGEMLARRPLREMLGLRPAAPSAHAEGEAEAKTSARQAGHRGGRSNEPLVHLHTRDDAMPENLLDIWLWDTREMTEEGG